MRYPPLAELLTPYSHFCVGSLPYTDPARALNFVREHPWIVPFWPELPRRGAAEYMLSRAERALSDDWDGYTVDEAAGFFGTVSGLRQNPGSVPLLKCQVMGPLAFVLCSEVLQGGLAEKLRAALGACVAQMEWQQQLLEECGCRVLFVLDEPGFAEWEKLGSAGQQAVKDVYSYLLVAASERCAYLGLHSCAPFHPDILDFPVELLSFDLWNSTFEEVYRAEYLTTWKELLQRGVVAVPGVFPAVNNDSADKVLQHTEDLYQQVVDLYCELTGKEAPHVLRAANCGHAFAEVEWVERVYAAGGWTPSIS